MPNEKYVFNFTPDEVKEINKILINHKKAITLQFLFVTIFLLLIGLSFLARFVSEKLEGFFLGGLVAYVVIMAISGFQNKKIRKANDNRIANNTYQYEFFDDYVSVSVTDAISTRFFNIKYSDVKVVENCETLYYFECAGMGYFLRKKDLIPNAKITTL